MKLSVWTKPQKSYKLSQKYKINNENEDINMKIWKILPQRYEIKHKYLKY